MLDQNLLSSTFKNIAYRKSAFKFCNFIYYIDCKYYLEFIENSSDLFEIPHIQIPYQKQLILSSKYIPLRLLDVQNH